MFRREREKGAEAQTTAEKVRICGRKRKKKTKTKCEEEKIRERGNVDEEREENGEEVEEEAEEREGNRRLQMGGLRCRGGLPRKSLSSHFICVCLASEESNCI